MSNLSQAGSTVTQSTPDTQVHSGALANFTWTDLDMSSVVGGAAAGLAILRCENNTGGVGLIYFRMNGDTTNVNTNAFNGTQSNIANGAEIYCAFPRR